MKAYQVKNMTSSKLAVRNVVRGESIEQKIERIVNNKEPIGGVDSAPIIYTERKEGIRASTNIRTDRFEVAAEASNKVAKSYKARREENANKREGKNDGEAKPTGANNEPAGNPEK